MIFEASRANVNMIAVFNCEFAITHIVNVAVLAVKIISANFCCVQFTTAENQCSVTHNPVKFNLSGVGAESEVFKHFKGTAGICVIMIISLHLWVCIVSIEASHLVFNDIARGCKAVEY